MSAIAEFFLIPRSTLSDLSANTLEPDFSSFLRSSGKSAVEFQWSGYIFNPLFPFLSKQIEMKPKNFEFAELARKLTEATGTYYLIFSSKEKEAFLDKLDPNTYSSETLGDFCSRFNGESESNAGEPMLAGVKALHDALSQVDTSNVLVFELG